MMIRAVTVIGFLLSCADSFHAPAATSQALSLSLRTRHSLTTPRSCAKPRRAGRQPLMLAEEGAGRRDALALGLAGALWLAGGQEVSAKASAAGNWKKDMAKLQVGLKGLDRLLGNWEEETTLCNYAEVTKELLETKNKAALLEAAKTNALFNKDASMVVKCKRTPQPIKEVMGFDDFEAPLYKSDVTVSKLRRRVDPDSLEEFIEAEEKYAQIFASAKAMTYSSGMREAELPVFKKGEEEGQDPFDRERKELTKARDTLRIIVKLLMPPAE